MYLVFKLEIAHII